MHSWYSLEEFVSLRYHVDWFGGQYRTDETEARVRDFYGVTGTPNLIFGGGEIRFSGASEAAATGVPYRQAFESLQGWSPFAMEIRNFDPAAGTFEVFIEVVSDPGALGTADSGH